MIQSGFLKESAAFEDVIGRHYFRFSGLSSFMMPKVLIVDDDLDLLEMVTIVLMTNNMNVLTLTKGDMLFESLTTDRPDIILMDIYLGESDGRALCHSLKSKEQFRDIPVILYSAGHITASSVQQSLANDFISKPFDINQLVNKINSAL